MFKGVSKWLGVIDNTEDEETLAVDSEGEETVVEPKIKDTQTEKSETDPATKDAENDDLISPETKKTLEDASAKAITTAKEWGSYLYTVGKHASEIVTEKAKELTKTVEEKTFLGDFSKEQDKFVTENKEKEKKSEAAVPPWIGYNEEESMKSQILALSQDKRNFLRNPPTGIQFPFEFDAVFPVAMSTLQEDPNLQEMRFELVPKQINEQTFWRNYFYRVSLIKQSTQLTSLTQQTEKSSPQTIQNVKEEDIVANSPQDNDEFISDDFQDGQLIDEDLKKEMQLLSAEDEGEKVEVSSETLPQWEQSETLPQWEQELQRELQEYEMVNEGGDIDDAELENEILQQIEQETENP